VKNKGMPSVEADASPQEGSMAVEAGREVAPPENELPFMTEDEINVTKDEHGYWQAFDFDWNIELFNLPPSFDEHQVRLVCAVVARRMEAAFNWGKLQGRRELQGKLASLLNLQPAESHAND